MGILDYERYDKNLLAIDNYSVLALQDITVLIAYFGAVRQFYRQVRAVLLYLEVDEIVNTYDKHFKNLSRKIIDFLKKYQNNMEAERNVRVFEDEYYELNENVGDLNQDILFIKQNVGLGIMIKKESTFEEKLSRGLGLKK